MKTSSQSSSSPSRQRFLHFAILTIVIIVIATLIWSAVLLQKVTPVSENTDATLTQQTIKKMLGLPTNLSTASNADAQTQTAELQATEAEVHKKLLVNYSQIWMSSTEVNMVLRHLHKRETYLEWGSGGSTLNFARFVKKRAVSIEHDTSWCAKMRESLTTDEALLHIEYRCVPVNRGTKGWGLRHKFEEGTYQQFRPYVDEIDNVGEDRFDIVIVDGRARVPCAVKALSFLTADSVLVLHDANRMFNPRNKASDYSAIQNYYDTVDSVGGHRLQGIVILRRKDSLQHLEGNHEEVQKILNDKFLTNVS